MRPAKNASNRLCSVVPSCDASTPTFMDRAGSVGLIAGGDWSSWVAMVQKVEHIGKAMDSHTSLDDRSVSRAEKDRTQAGVLCTDDVPSGVVTHEDRVRRR